MISEAFAVPKVCVSGLKGPFTTSENRGTLASGHPREEGEKSDKDVKGSCSRGKHESPFFSFTFAEQSRGWVGVPSLCHLS